MWNPLKKNKTRVIYKVRDLHGLIELWDNDTTRTMYFGTDSKQSSMYLDPTRKENLVLDYTKAMTACLLFQEHFSAVLMLGLGGGSVPKFLLRHFPNCLIDVVEHRESVKEIALNYFEVPSSHPRLRIHTADAGEFVRKLGNRKYDQIYIDAYDPNGMSDAVKGLGFINACRTHLTEDGIAIFNLWSSHKEVYFAVIDAMRTSFSSRILQMPVWDKANTILFGFNGAIPRHQIQNLSERAEFLADKTKAEFPKMLKDLQKYNAFRL